MTLPLGQQILLAKAATDSGFDQPLGDDGAFLHRGTTRAEVEIWLGVDGEVLLCALSRADVAAALDEHGQPALVPLPRGAVAARRLADVHALHRLLRRIDQLARTLPNALLVDFEARVQVELTSALAVTEVQRLVTQRVGQDIFRAGLLDYWDGRCCLTGLAVPELLRASHIKPWKDCASNAERLDVFNGLLLAAHLDAAFDQGFVTFADDGVVVVSPEVPAEAAELLGLGRLPAAKLEAGHRVYLAHHRARVFRSRSSP